MTLWNCRVCGHIADHDGPARPDGWYLLRLTGDVKTHSRSPILGLLCSVDCLAVAAMKPYGLTEAQVRAWLAGEPAVDR